MTGAAVTTAGLRRPVTAGIVGKVAEGATLALLATVVPRLLGPAGYGRLSVALTLVAVGSVAMTLGGATLLARFVPAAPPAERPALARLLTVRLARNRVGPFAVLALLGVVAAVAAPDRFPPRTTAWVLVALALNVAATLALQADLGLGRAAAWSARYPVQNVVLVAAVLALHAAGLAPAAAVVVAGAAGLVLAAVATAGLWRTGATVPVELPAGASRFGALQAGSGALTQVVQRGGVVAVALLAGSDRETGFAAAAIGATLAATYAVAQVFTVALPALTARHAAATPGPAPTPPHGDLRQPDPPLGPPHGDLWQPDPPLGPPHGDLRRSGPARPGHSPAEAALRRLAGGLLAVVLPAVLAGVVAVDVAVPLVLGPAYTGAVDAVEIALAGVVLAPLNALVVQAAALRMRPGAALAAAAAGAVAFVACALPAVPAWGAVGGVTAALAGTAAAAVTSLVVLPGAAGWRLAVASLGGAAAVTAWSVLT